MLFKTKESKRSRDGRGLAAAGMEGLKPNLTMVWSGAGNVREDSGRRRRLCIMMTKREILTFHWEEEGCRAAMQCNVRGGS